VQEDVMSITRRRRLGLTAVLLAAAACSDRPPSAEAARAKGNAMGLLLQ
jgi:hypothetical protein